MRALYNLYPPNYVSVWEKLAELERAEWPRQIIGATALGVSVIVMGYGFPLLVVSGGHELVDMVASPWGIAGFAGEIPLFLWGLFSVAGVLLGAWGVLAVCVSATVNAMPILGDELAALLSVSALLVALIPAWAFRHFKGDPRIRTSRDMVLFLLFGVILANLASVFIAHTLMYTQDHFSSLEAMFRYTTPRYYAKASISTLILGFFLLIIGSRIVIKARAYCRGWFS